MSQQLMITADHPVPVEPQGGAVSVQVEAGDTLYFADNQQVSAANNQGTITNGATRSFSGNAWVVSAGLSSVLMTNSGGGFAPSALRATTQTGPAGVAAINGTQNTLTWTAPNDGRLHSVLATSILVVTSNETGGGWNANFTLGGSALTLALHGTGKTTAQSPVQTTDSFMCDPNTTVTIQQSSALTAGAATVFQSLVTDA